LEREKKKEKMNSKTKKEIQIKRKIEFSAIKILYLHTFVLAFVCYASEVVTVKRFTKCAFLNM